MNTTVDRLLPHPTTALDDEQILAHYSTPPGPWLRVNFISSLDGAATHSGTSGGLGDEADRRIFALLRRKADVILVGAGTVRIEGYRAQRLAEDAVAWRTARGLTEHPHLALISGSLDLDPQSEVFTDAPTKPIIYTLESAAGDRRHALERVADVVTVGSDALDVRALRADLIERGLPHIHSEGGPRAFGALLKGDVVDELCLTVAPSIEAGTSPRIAYSAEATPRDMEMAGLLRSGNELFLRMVRTR